MKCYTPMIRVYQEADRQTKQKIKDSGNQLIQYILPREEVNRRLRKNENYYQYVKRINKDNERNNNKWRYQIIPCRHCYACSMNYSAEWATRIMYQCQKSEHNYFITLTYDEEHLPILDKIHKGDWIFENDGTWIEGSLQKKDSQDFIKRLRRHLERKNKLDNFKFFLCGEYGSQTGRPHIHAILMDCKLDLNKFYDVKIDTNMKEHWKSKELEELWNKGIIDVATVEWSSAAYVARYCAKKWLKSSDDLEYITKGKIPEYIAMSKNIGKDYYLNNKNEIYKTDSITVKTFTNEACRLKPPKAWDRLLEKENPELFDKIKKQRNICRENAEKMQKHKANYTDQEIQLMSAEKTITKALMLKREM